MSKVHILSHSHRWETLCEQVLQPCSCLCLLTTSSLTFNVSWWKLISKHAQLDDQVINAHNYLYTTDVWQFGIKQKFEILPFLHCYTAASVSALFLCKINQKEKILWPHSVGSLCHLEAHWGVVFCCWHNCLRCTGCHLFISRLGESSKSQCFYFSKSQLTSLQPVLFIQSCNFSYKRGRLQISW